MKYVIEITEIDTCPEGWADTSAWPKANRIYAVTSEPRYLYVVGEYSVSLVYDKRVLCDTPHGEHDETVGGISESLFLRAIAAASRAEVPK